MAGVHPLEDLAPRDVVAAAISDRMAEAPAGVDDHVYLDATHLGERFYTRFPSITEACRAIGVDPARDRIPVAPAAHYACGGVPAGLDGTTGLAGLYAVGEVSCTGVHGANRLASNSLTESVVAGTRLGRDLAWEVPEPVEPQLDRRGGGRARRCTSRRDPRRRCRGMSASTATPSRSRAAAAVLDAVAGKADPAGPMSRVAWESTNLLTVASAVVLAAATRSESRGCHRRTDHPRARRRWLRHLDVRASIDGRLEVELIVQFHPLPDDTRQRLLDGRPRSRRRRCARAHGARRGSDGRSRRHVRGDRAAPISAAWARSAAVVTASSPASPSRPQRSTWCVATTHPTSSTSSTTATACHPATRSLGSSRPRVACSPPSARR